jgi:pyrroline-5-carboxylate reductase
MEVYVFYKGFFDCFFSKNYLRLIGAEVRDSCGCSGTVETPQAFTPRRLNARPAESEHL